MDADDRLAIAVAVWTIFAGIFTKPPAVGNVLPAVSHRRVLLLLRCKPDCGWSYAAEGFATVIDPPRAWLREPRPALVRSLEPCELSCFGTSWM